MPKNNKKPAKMKALLLFSGGLDSILAAKILERQGIEVAALAFAGYFFDAAQAKKSAEDNGIKLIVEDFSEPHFKVVKNPRFGRGAGMNPCVDCHLLMLTLAKKIAAREKYDIIATGEVLGQRPMSQNARTLALIEREAGLSGRILRPLSAKVLPETEYEKMGIVNREKLGGFSGRSRKEQLELAEKFGVENFPSPAGGCILTDKEYSKKLRELLEMKKSPDKSDIELLRIGRHFWADGAKIILGRNHKENLKIKELADLLAGALAKEGKGDILIEPKSVPGPTVLVRGKSDEKVVDSAKKLLLKYTKGADNNTQIKITA
jgi:hypothetical protein